MPVKDAFQESGSQEWGQQLKLIAQSKPACRTLGKSCGGCGGGGGGGCQNRKPNVSPKIV